MQKVWQHLLRNNFTEIINLKNNKDNHRIILIMNADILDAIARAKAIAAKLTADGVLGGEGKRKFDDLSAPGLGSQKRKKVYVPVKQFPEINFIGLIIGPKGSTQKLLQDKSGAKILLRGRGSHKEGGIPSPDDDDDLHVLIEGSEDAVEIANREIEQILFNPEEALKLKGEQLRSLNNLPGSYGLNDGEYSEEIKVPNNIVGYIIGKGGETVQKLHSQTGAFMQIAKETDMKPGDTHRSILLKGDKSRVADLRSKIEELVSSKTGGGRSNNSVLQDLDTPIVMKVPIPNDRVGLLIGKGGATVKAIQEKTGTTILIPPEPDAADPLTRTISIGAYTKDQANAAHAEIFMNLQQSATSNNTMLICVPDDRVGNIIGRGGCHIKDIQNRLRVRVQIPQFADPGSNPPIRTCTIQGTPEAQEAARYEIEMILQGQTHLIQKNNYASSAQAYDPTAAAMMYGSTYGGSYDPQTYSQQVAGYYQATATGQPQTDQQQTAIPTDPTAYYNDFWVYASYYGETAARTYYGAWSPPTGTKAPDGVIVPVDSASASTANAINNDNDSTLTIERDSKRIKEDESDNITLSNAKNSIADSYTNADPHSNTVSTTNSEVDSAAWDAYKKQYSEWYESYGKFNGASPDPPVA